MTPSTELPDPSEAELHLTQVDPPHPFKSAWKTFAVAAVLVTAAIAIYYYLIQKPPDAAGEILAVNYYPVNTTINGGGGGDPGMQGSKESYDQLIILAKVRVRNQTNIPLFLQDISATVTLPDGSQQVNVGAGVRDFDRVFQAFPTLAPLRAQPFDRSATLQPGQSTEGLAIFNFPLSRQQWDSRKSGDVVVSFMHQPNLLLSIAH
ncbi:MAG TPA: hypothetical protein VGM27_09510 [Acidobacteriaceae bacterium]